MLKRGKAMKMGNVNIRVLNDGSVDYKATLIRDKQAYRATFKTEEEARKWLKKTHNKWKDSKVKETMGEDTIVTKEVSSILTEKGLDERFDIFANSINYILQEQLELQHKVDKLFNLLRSI